MEKRERLKEKAQGIKEILDRLFPDPPIPLYHTNPFTMCIAVLLSAQNTDKGVNAVTPALFKLADNPADMFKLGVDRIRTLIAKIGLANTKSRNVWNLSRILLEKHGGELPRTFEGLEALPGVGHKTASVVMCQAFGVPAFAVDTHIHRLAERWGLSSGKSVEHTEADLKALYPESAWTKLHLQIIYYGREFCPARNHDVNRCEICARYAVNTKKEAAAGKSAAKAGPARAKRAAAKAAKPAPARTKKKPEAVAPPAGKTAKKKAVRA